MEASLLQSLGIVDCAVFQFEDHKLKLLHANDTWFASLFPRLRVGETTLLKGEPFYLVDFMLDAEEFWRSQSDGRINSGLWSEKVQGGVLRLEAAAISKAGLHYLVLFNLENEYNKRQKTLQSARELLISNDQVLQQHEQLRSRVEELVGDAQRILALQAPVRKVIEQTDIGVAILDENQQIQEQNPALYRLFDLSDKDTQQPAALLLELCQRQFPELTRVMATLSEWNGELYWLKPPAFSCWLKVTLSPVMKSPGKLGHWLFLATDVSREKYLQQSNERLTYFDVLTNLPNRRYLWQSLEAAIELKQEFFFMQINIKDLKRINEIYGHSIGDEVMKGLVERLRSVFHQNDVLARIGGNEFAVILRPRKESCEAIAKRLLGAIAEPFYVLDRLKCRVGLGVGIAHYPRDGINAEDIMKYADLAAYTAKRCAKSEYQFYSTELKENSRKRIELEAALRDAIEEQQFELFLQPILDLTTGQIHKAEALIRWRRHEGQLISPDEFIPIAEQTGLIVPIGQWVIQKATQLLAQLHAQHQHISLSVNLSPSQISDRHLLEFIHQSVEKNSVDAAFLELELTEGVLVNDFDKVQHFLEEVRKLGVSIAIDDFGTGYSSLSYLQKLPIDHLKIDRSFVKDLNHSESDQAIVMAVIAMAKSLQLGVIAEGVENQEQQQFLCDHECQTAQGYLYSRPVPFHEFCRLLKE